MKESTSANYAEGPQVNAKSKRGRPVRSKMIKGITKT